MLDSFPLPTSWPGATSEHTKRTRKRDEPDVDDGNLILIPKNPFDFVAIDQVISRWREYKDAKGIMKQLQFTKIHAPSHRGFTAGYFFDTMPRCLYNDLQQPQVAAKHRLLAKVTPDNAASRQQFSSNADRKESVATSNNSTERLHRRLTRSQKPWELSAISVPWGIRWKRAEIL